MSRYSVREISKCVDKSVSHCKLFALLQIDTNFTVIKKLRRYFAIFLKRVNNERVCIKITRIFDYRGNSIRFITFHGNVDSKRRIYLFFQRILKLCVFFFRLFLISLALAALPSGTIFSLDAVRDDMKGLETPR